MTRDMLERAKDAGVTAMVATPHVYRPAQHEVNLSAAPVALHAANQARMTFGLGCEFNYRALIRHDREEASLVQQLRQNPGVLAPYCMVNTNCLLLELSNDDLFPDWEIVLTELIERGYQPIIAHPERYVYIQKDIAIAQEMIDYGCELQVDAGGLMAGLLTAERKIARRMLSEGMVSYIASDAHRPEHYAVFEKVFKTFRHEWPRKNQLKAQLKRR